MIEFEERFLLDWNMSLRSLRNRLNQLVSFVLLLPVFALGLYVVFGNELDVNILRKPLLPFWVGADTVLYAHSIDAMSECRIYFGSKILDFFEWFFLLLEDLTNLIFNIV